MPALIYSLAVLISTILIYFYIFYFLVESEILLSIFVSIMIYPNADKDKSKILSDLKGFSEIYMDAY